MSSEDVRIQYRTDTAANWTSVNPILLNGEAGYESDGKKMKIGDGQTAWNILAYTATSGISGYSGLGLSGYSGFSGLSGYSSVSGFSGKSGYSGSGISGYSGSGISGYSGLGISGYSGSGISGYSGSGISGYSGFSGKSGYSGSGLSGYSGYSGISGYSGYSGISGYSGTVISTGTSGNLMRSNGSIWTSSTTIVSVPKVASVFVVNGTLSVANGVAYLRIGRETAGHNLIYIGIAVTTPSSSGLPSVQLSRGRQSSPTSAHTFVSMLSTVASIDVSEYDSVNAATPAVIDTNNDDLAEGDLLRIDVTIAGTGTQNLIVTIESKYP